MFRLVFKKAREDPRSNFHVYVSAALMEYYCSKVHFSLFYRNSVLDPPVFWIQNYIFRIGILHLKSYNKKNEYKILPFPVWGSAVSQKVG